LEPLLQVLATTASSHRISGVAWWLAREPGDISVEDILRSIGSMEDDSDEIAAADWSLLNEVVLSPWLLRDLCFGNDLTYFFVAEWRAVRGRVPSDSSAT
jgi:hypothetical protein